MTKFEILDLFVKNGALSEKEILTIYGDCLLYTSDAADE